MSGSACETQQSVRPQHWDLSIPEQPVLVIVTRDSFENPELDQVVRSYGTEYQVKRFERIKFMVVCQGECSEMRVRLKFVRNSATKGKCPAHSTCAVAYAYHPRRNSEWHTSTMVTSKRAELGVRFPKYERNCEGFYKVHLQTIVCNYTLPFTHDSGKDVLHNEYLLFKVVS